METPVTKILDEKGIKYSVKEHKTEVFTCEMAAKERNCKLSQIVKTMIGKDSDNNLHVCLIPGDKRLKLKKVRKEAGGIKIDLANPEDIAKDLGLTVGAISPLLFPEGTKFYLDPTVLEEDLVDISSGDPMAGVEIASKDLVELVKGKLCDIISTS